MTTKIRLFEVSCGSAIIAAKLRHPNIVQFIGVYYDDKDDEQNLPIMVMETNGSELNFFGRKTKAY